MDDIGHIPHNIEEFISGRLRNLSGDWPSRLYHYTSNAGMRGIAATKTILAGSVQKLNDASELRFGLSVMRACIERCYAQESNSAVLRLFDVLRSKIEYRPEEENYMFILSFSASEDDRLLWNLYGDKGHGFCLEFDPTHIQFGAELVKCQYGEEVLTSFCKDSITFLRDFYLCDQRRGVPIDPSEYAGWFAEKIYWRLLMFKPEVWRDEKEWRMICASQRHDSILYKDRRSYLPLPEQGELTSICIWSGAKITEAIPSLFKFKSYIKKSHCEAIFSNVDAGNSFLAS